jgi:hypothetical protein
MATTHAQVEQLLLKVQDAEAKFEDCHDGYGAEHPYTVKAEQDMVAAQQTADAAQRELASQPFVQTHVSLYHNGVLTLCTGTKRIMAKRQVPAKQLSGYGHALLVKDMYLQVAGVEHTDDRVTVRINDHNGQREVSFDAEQLVDLAALG